MFIRNSSNDKFIQKGINTFSAIGKSLIHDLTQDMDSKINAEHFLRMGMWDANQICLAFGINPINAGFFCKCVKDFELGTFKEIIIHNGDYPKQALQNVLNRIPQHICNRLARFGRHDVPKMEYKVPITVNLFREVRKIKHREIFYSNQALNEEIDPIFTQIRNIKHPRERMTQFMKAHNKTYTNEKLARLKIIDDPHCTSCGQIETINHLFIECPRTKKIAEIVQTKWQINIFLIPTDNKDLKIFSLISHFIYAQRNEPFSRPIFEARIGNRIQDLNIINWKNKRNSNNPNQLGE